MLKRLFFALIMVGAPFAAVAQNYELVMVKRDGCVYCVKWEQDLEPIYPKTDVGQFAPLRKIDIAETRSDPDPYAMPVVFTPTFVLMKDGVEMRRMEGYQSEDFFWGVLEMILDRETEFEKGAHND